MLPPLKIIFSELPEESTRTFNSNVFISQNIISPQFKEKLNILIIKILNQSSTVYIIFSRDLIKNHILYICGILLFNIF